MDGWVGGCDSLLSRSSFPVTFWSLFSLGNLCLWGEGWRYASLNMYLSVCCLLTLFLHPLSARPSASGGCVQLT